MRIIPFFALLGLAACKTQETPASQPGKPEEARVAEPTCNDPEAFVRGLYGQYQEGAKSLEYGTFFDDAMLALIKRDHDLAHGEVPFLDYDPICNCQDWEKIAVNEVRVVKDPDTVASVAFSNAGTIFRQDFFLTCTASGWRVHDIVVKSEGRSLRDSIARSNEMIGKEMGE